jgi:hypothetical protein
MDLEYFKKVQEWVGLDNIIQTSKDELKPIIEQKAALETDILTYIEEKKFEDLTVNITDGTIKFGKKTVTQGLSGKVVKGMLDTYAQEKGITIDVDDFCNYMARNLEKKISISMKRSMR